MSQPSQTENESPRRSRFRRRETIINTLACVLGCLALVVMIATVFRVTTAKLWESTQINPDYVDAVYEDVQGRGWSGNTKENQALIASSDDVKPAAPPLRSRMCRNRPTRRSARPIRRQPLPNNRPPVLHLRPFPMSMASKTLRASVWRSRPSSADFSKQTRSI